LALPLDLQSQMAGRAGVALIRFSWLKNLQL
jgi:hypothetical protein